MAVDTMSMIERIGLKTRTRKIVFSIVSVIVGINILATLLFGLTSAYGPVVQTADFSSEAESVPCIGISQTFTSSSPHLKSVELYFMGLPEDDGGKEELLFTVEEGEKKLFMVRIPASELVEHSWNEIFINMPLNEGMVYAITINASGADGEAFRVPAVLQAADSFQSYIDNRKIDETIVFRYNYMEPLGMLDSALLIMGGASLLILLFVLLNRLDVIICYVKKLIARISNNQNRGVISAAGELFLCGILIACSGIQFQNDTVVLFLGISFVAGFWAWTNCGQMGRLVDSAGKRIIFWLLSFYTAFALVGQRIFIYPLNIIPSWQGVMVYCAAVLWSVPVLSLLIRIMHWCATRFVSKNPDPSHQTFIERRYCIICAVLLVLPAAIHLIAVNPGISSPDTSLVLTSLMRNLHGVNDWHPPFYSMCLRAITEVWDSTYAIILIQYVFWVLVLMSFLKMLRRNGVSVSILLAAAFLIGINAGNFFHLNTIWKDVPYAIALVWAFVSLAKMLFDKNSKHQWVVYFEFAIALALICLFRKNGFVTFGVIALFSLIVFRNKPAVWSSVVASGVLVAIVFGPVYSYFEVQNDGNRGSYIGLGQDILGVYYSDGSVSQDTLDLIVQMRGDKVSKSTYIPTYALQEYDVDVSYLEFIHCYIDTFIRNPSLMTKAIIAREDDVWNIFTGEDAKVAGVSYSGTEDGQSDWNTYYPARKTYAFSDYITSQSNTIATSQVLSTIEWRGGLSGLLSLVALSTFVLFGVNKRYLLLAAPIMGQVMSVS